MNLIHFLHQRPRLRWGLLAVICMLGAVSHQAARAQDDEIVFGLIPALSPEVMVQRYQPLAVHLSDEIGVPVRLQGAPDYQTFMNLALEGSNYDLMITGADFFRLAERRSGYRAIARVDGVGVQAIIVAAGEKGFASLSDLPENVRVATVGELALMHRLGEQTLREHGINFGENASPVPTPSHNAAMLSVLSNRADIAIIAAPFFSRVDKDVRNRIDVLARTGSAPHHPISVGPQVNTDTADRLTAALLALPETPEGRAALEAMNFPGFVTVEAGLYDIMDWAADDIESLLGLEGN